ncbi:2-phospho-L-lactate transferase [Steroidobacter denitrificans]|uniref:2-phospho-L-lactate transferase n=1 Tax=Steroidobacter denitrificans TaxID=465721 RepID=A0A127FAC8_STEDE|nr:2-phospho-L-lactate transferase [Steroidobacter denitrificans]AMN46555.1 2-phospho-L-lactate transferase [Steroidobacter denitrificans]
MSAGRSPAPTTGTVLALAGGVGGARLAYGLAAQLEPSRLTIVVNTADDFEHLGLHISPDLDTMTYTLAGINDPAQGWGIRGESWAAMAALKRLGGEDWFALGDQDMATHLLRSLRLRSESLSDITSDFAHRLGIRHRIVPMSDDPVRTMVDTDAGRLAFQDYFVRRRCQPRFLGLDFAGSASARPGPAFLAALEDPALEAIIICPSNPLLSIRPILALPGIEERLRQHPAPVLAVSPFIGGQAVKGPAAKMLQEIGLPATPAGLLQCYEGLLDALIIDRADAEHAAFDGGERRIPVLVTDTLMRNAADQLRLAGEVLAFVQTLSAAGQ